ncbi:2-hydroxy-6 [Seminavis robusta]|uniref:2-hydroxy-6 n=1 Tax=Seminavis robusta TaxID=568900 RepID=A0A9N8DHL8_9STRA|nr:2-hydroxy-6 [Seminavis robusta]|eukprot:Sro163_g073060.1 2-hydroxy-6 (386) ;mRNA; f:12926-14083
MATITGTKRATMRMSAHHHHRQKDTMISGTAAERLRFAEHALLKKHGVQGITTELIVSLRENHPDLAGISWARVLRVELSSPHNKQSSSSSIPLVMIHGGGGTPGDWISLVPHVIQPGRTMYLVERPGNGLSDPLDYSTVDLARFSSAFVSEVLNALQLDKVHLVGNSMGGATVVWYALNQLEQQQEQQQQEPQESEQQPQQQEHQQSIASISLVGVPAGFQGMNVPWMAGCIQPWMGVLASFFPAWLPFVPLLILCFGLHVPLSGISMVYLVYVWKAHSIRHNTISFFSVMRQLYDCAHDLDSEKGWKLQDLVRLSHHVHGNLCVVTGTADPFITPAQQAEITNYIGPEKHISNLATGHVPWLVDPTGYAQTLEKFWAQAEGRD